jgi:hypothetical protein
VSRVYADHFAQIPEWMLFEEGLSDRAVRLFGVLLRYARTDDRAFPGRKTLAAHLSCSVDSVDRALAELGRVEHAGIPAVESRPAKRKDGSQTSNSYWLWPAVAPDVEEEVRKGAGGEPQGCGPLAAETRPGASRKGAAPRKKDSVLEGETEDRHTVSQGKTAQEQAEKFAEFTAAYPINTFKKDTRMAWDEAIANGTDPDEIIDAAYAYSFSDTVLDGKPMAPHRWLMAERWDDEIEPADLLTARERRYAATEARFLATANGATINTGGNA